MICKTAFFAVIISSLLYSGHPISIDGLFDDWAEVDINYSDFQGDGDNADFADIKITYDNDFLFIYFNVHDGEYLMQDWENTVLAHFTFLKQIQSYVFTLIPCTLYSAIISLLIKIIR